MKSSSIDIKKSAFNVNLKYTRLQNKTKELFFRCLYEGRDIEYFNERIEALWGNIDHSFMDDEIAEYEAIIHERNTHGKEVEREIPEGEYGSLFSLVPISVLIAVEHKFMKTKEREYKRSINSPAYKKDKVEYLKLKVPNYTDNMITYYKKGMPRTKENEVRQVSPAVYNSMVYNTNLTRSVWNTTLNDAGNANWFIIRYHPFSCPHCIEHQNRPLTKRQVIDMVGFAEEAEGDILHPNCACILSLYDGNLPEDELTDMEKAEIYNIRQKVNGLTLKKERLLTDMKIAKEGGYMDLYDEYNKQRNKVNATIRELKNSLPTEALQKQVVAINR